MKVISMILSFAMLSVLFTNPSYARGLNTAGISQRIETLFNAANANNKEAQLNSENMALDEWMKAIRGITKPTNESGAAVHAALLAHYADTLNYFLREPTRIKNDRINSFWSSILISAERRAELLAMPVKFELISTQVVDDEIRATIQLWPELSGTNPNAQVTFILTNDGSQSKIKDIYILGASFLTVWTGGLAHLKQRPNEVVNGLLQKNLISQEEIHDYQRFLLQRGL